MSNPKKYILLLGPAAPLNAIPGYISTYLPTIVNGQVLYTRHVVPVE